MSINIAWLYPELMSTYGDRGNIEVLESRLSWREFGVTVLPVDFRTTAKELATCDLIFGGGAQDRQQGIVIGDLQKKRAILKKLFDRGVPGLFVCGSPQLLGHYFIDGSGRKITGLGIFDMVTEYPEDGRPRCIGNLVARLNANSGHQVSDKIVGFENHGGRTYLGKGVKPFATVLYGHGNNGDDQTEGAVYQNCLATYSHGPFLPKNPHIADWLLQKALEVKYGREIKLEKLDDTLEWQAHNFMLHRLGIKP